MAEILLQGSGINKSFGARGARRQVLFDVDVDVRAGECLAVIGGSGSGKTTLTRILLGLETADSGVVEYRGHNIAEGRQGLRMLREESGLVFQDPFSSLDPRWRVGSSVAEPLKLRRKKLPSAAVKQRVAEVLGLVGLDSATLGSRYPIDLSGGQAQRVAIARAIVAKPKVVLADEALSAIDVAVRVQILDAFAAIRRADPDMALIMVSHDLGVVRHIADRILVLHEGRVEESGPTARLLAHSQSAYTRRLIEAASL
ncbi:ABC transporter ATP-binding protein [Bifidobacterium panos]|uniref:Peptide ABC transporter ATPase n=1 Tax=Bifidobacterium panos TaxID=2675321 RepID=A0ABX1SXI5_9BIFI|nr:dipeptide/oligopeptide/nickel ABC transporter ATP-binding protein [Bifidobacterium sp. DSM 109963]NMN02541.1 peptide ABC transporter ATPase [Bifidobacterium sp. DSM 109963]